MTFVKNDFLLHVSACSRSIGDDEVRAPIPPVRQVLVDTFSDMDVPLSHRTRSHVPFAPFRDFRGEAQYREDLASGESDPDLGPDTAKRRTLEELFRPPIDIMFPGPFDGVSLQLLFLLFVFFSNKYTDPQAKERGLRENRWLMVDVQDETDFRCQCLNRDVWSSPAVKSIIGECFVFWQVNKDHREGQRFMQFYPVKQFPYVAILDPQTGEQVVQWNTIKDPNMFCELVTDFLEQRPTPSGELPDHHSSAVAPVVSVPPDPEKIVGMSEDEQLKAAIAALLRDPGKSVVNVEDVDEINCDDDSPVEIGNHIDKSPVGAEVTSSGIDPVDGEEKSVEADSSDYRLFLGQSSELANLVLRFPDGQREVVTVPSDSKLKVSTE